MDLPSGCRNNQRLRCRIGAIAALLCVFSASISAAPVDAAESVGWRFWTAAEGLTEAYSTSVSSLGKGRIAVRHGDVTAFDILDGFEVTALPDRHWLGRIHEDAAGTLYTFNDKGPATYKDGAWKAYGVPQIGAIQALKKFAFRIWFDYCARPEPVASDSAAVVPVSNGRAIILSPGQILDWNSSGETRVIRTVGQTLLGEFLAVEPAGPDSVWVMGKDGFARLTVEKSGKRGYQWAEIHPSIAGMASFSRPFQYPDGRIFVMARGSHGTRAGIVVDGSQASVVAATTGEESLLWPGEDGRIWMSGPSGLGYVSAGQSRQLPASPELAGQVLDVLPEKGGSFWLATSQKLAHYSPPLWRDVPGSPSPDTLVNSITEDSRGRIWMAAQRKLIENDHGVWREYPLPPRETYRISDARGVSALDDGTLMIDVQADDHHLIFDPAARRFHRFTRGEGQNLGLVLPRRKGGLWVESYSPSAQFYRFEILEHGVYRPVPGMEKMPMSEFRDVLETRNGDLWVGTTSYLARIHQGKLHVMSAADGFQDSGAYAFFEAADNSIYIGGRRGLTVWDGRRFSPIQTDMDRSRSFTGTPDGALWVASGSGVYSFRNGEWIGNSNEEGLPGAAYRVFCDSTGRLWAGTTFGLRVYHPDADLEAPSTGISEERNLRKAPPGGDVRLNFAGTDKWRITREDRLLFSYSLDNGPWSRFDSDNFASYKSMPAGAHVFHVRAIDRNGNADTRGASFEFSVLRPLYREPLFLVLLLTAILAVGALIRAALQRHARLRFESTHDPLTRLLNRAAFEAALDQAVDVTAESGQFAVMFVDLDGFKRVNDTLGHQFGDLLLVAIAGRIASCLRSADSAGRIGALAQASSLARIGGDEFAVILPSADSALAERVALRILESVRGCTSLEGHSVRISCCIGISLFPDHGEDAATLLRLADVAMYQGKAGSKDCSQVFDPVMSKIDFRNSGMAVIVREALDYGYLYLLYQPIQNSGGTVIEMEALARISHPDRGQISPTDFIPVAEETGFIVPLGMWVLREALRQARIWQDGDFPVRVAVNVSPVQFNDPGFADSVFRCIDEAGVPPMALAIEITESTLARNWSVVAPQIERLRTAGVSISLDDFGTGYSSLSRLHSLPVDSVKIDRSFVAGMSADLRSFELVRDTIALAHKLGYRVVSEGVESIEQIDNLRAMDCDQYQGFLLSRPVSPEEATHLLGTAREPLLSKR